MNALVATLILTGIIFALLVSPAAADGPPTLNMGPTCDAAAAGAIITGRNKHSCMEGESAARDL